MQQGIPEGDVFRPAVSATIGSLDVDVSSVQVDRELPDPLTSGRLNAASAVLTATVGDDVSETVATPWDPGAQWPPAPEAPASVSMDMGPGMVQSLTGRVASVDGGGLSREVSVEIADLYQSLDREISWDGLGDQMPHPVEEEDTRFVGLHTLQVTDMMLRHCGWYATPPPLSYCLLSVPAQGTMWPERGTLLTSTTYGRPSGDTSVYPQFYRTDWGLGASYVDSRYTVWGSGYTIRDRGRIELVGMTQSIGGRDDMQLVAYTGQTGSLANGVRLRWTADYIYVDVAGSSGTFQNAVNVQRWGGIAYATVEYVTDTSVQVTVQNSQGVTSTATVSCAPSVTTAVYTQGRIIGNHLGGGFQIAMPGTGRTLASWTASAVLHRGPSAHNIKVRPPVHGRTVSDLLAEQCAAENATYWIDELGVLQWWHLEELELRGNSATLTAADHVTDLSWSHSLSSVKSQVTVKWKDWAYQSSYRSSIDLWQGSGITIEPNSTVEDFIEVPSDEVWLQPDLTFLRVGGNSSDPDATFFTFNKARRSWWGGIREGTDEWAQVSGSLAFAINKVGPGAFKYRITWTGAESCEMKTPSASVASSVSMNKRSMDMPILRGKGKYILADMSTLGATTGPSTAPEHVIDAGWWIQEEEQAQRVADFAAERLTVPQPRVSSISLIMIPGLQLGDVVTVVDDAVSRLTIRGILEADSRSISDDMGVSHAVSIRPLSVTRNGVTWAQWGEFMNGATWQAWGASQAGKTWAQWAENPLAG